jgi:outer membrane usher protein
VVELGVGVGVGVRLGVGTGVGVGVGVGVGRAEPLGTALGLELGDPPGRGGRGLPTARLMGLAVLEVPAVGLPWGDALAVSVSPIDGWVCGGDGAGAGGRCRESK